MDLEVCSMEVVARLQVDKIVGTVEGTVERTVEGTVERTVEGTVERTVEGTVERIVEGTVEGTVEHTVEGTVDTDSLLLDYIDLDSLQNRLKLLWLHLVNRSWNQCQV